MPGGGRGPGFVGGAGLEPLGPPPPAQVLVLDGQRICGTLELEVADETELLEGVRDPSGLHGVDELVATLGEELSRETGRAVGLVRAMV